MKIRRKVSPTLARLGLFARMIFSPLNHQVQLVFANENFLLAKYIIFEEALPIPPGATRNKSSLFLTVGTFSPIEKIRQGDFSILFFVICFVA